MINFFDSQVIQIIFIYQADLLKNIHTARIKSF